LAHDNLKKMILLKLTDPLETKTYQFPHFVFGSKWGKNGNVTKPLQWKLGGKGTSRI